MTRVMAHGIERMDKYGKPIAMVVDLGKEAREGMPMHREKVRLAYNALAALADGEEADETFGAASPGLMV